MTTKPACLAMAFSSNLWGSSFTKCGFGGRYHQEIRQYYHGILADAVKVGETTGAASMRMSNAQLEQACREWYLRQIKYIGATPVMVMICDYQSDEWEAFKRNIPINIIYQSAKTWNSNYPEEKEPYITVYIFQFDQEKL